jgi:hypothetical protein
MVGGDVVVRTIAVLGMLTCVVGTVAARVPPPVPCPGTRFVSDVSLSGGAAPFDVVVVGADGTVRIDGWCAPILAKLSRSRAGTTVRGTWDTCGTTERVRLRLRLDAPACTAGTKGKVRARGRRGVTFTAAPTRCGDGHVDTGAGESCEQDADCSGQACGGCVCGGTTTTTLPGGLFEAANPWNEDVSTAPVSSESSSIIGALAAAGGWGNGNVLQIDFSIHLLHATPTTPFSTFVESAGYYSPDCDDAFPFPLPSGGAIEGQSGYTCNVGNDDCHLLVVDEAQKRLYEMYHATVVNGTLRGQCGIVWDLTKSYPANLRGDQCTSADAAGFPISAMLFTADEVAAGEITHAIRFILPNERMRAGAYVHPATHAGGPSGGPDLPPYGVRFRLRADFPLASLPSDGARVVARAMQKYGMFLSDGGNIALTAASDAYTTHTWDEVGIDSHSLFGIAVTDMDVVELGPTVPLTYDCVRNP